LVFVALKDIIVSAMTLDTTGIKQGVKDLSNATMQSLTGVEDVIGALGEANKKYQETLKASNDLLARQQKNILLEREMGVERKKQNADLQEARALVRDETVSFEERLDALKKVRDSEIDLAGRELALQQDKLDVLQAQKKLGLNLGEDNQELADQQAKVFETQQQYQEVIMKLQRDENALQRGFREYKLSTLREEISAQERASSLAIQRVEDQMTKAGKIVELAVLKQKAFEDNLEKETNARFLAYKQEYLNKLFTDEQATTMAMKRTNEELEIESLAINKEVEDKKLERAKSRAEAVYEYENTVRQRDYNASIFQAESKNNRVLALEIELDALRESQRVQYMDRLATMSENLRAQGLSATEASYEAERLLREQNAIEEEALTRRLAKTKFEVQQEYLNAYLSLAKTVGTAVFGENKAIAAASAIVDTYSGAVAALGMRPWTYMNYVNAAAVVVAGMANVRKILAVNKNSKTASSATPSQPNISTSFGLVDVGTNAPIAEQVAMGASPSRQSMNPTFVFEGDMNPEVMTIKVKQGSDAISSRTIGVGV
jgi:hypothetical protein